MLLDRARHLRHLTPFICFTIPFRACETLEVVPGS